MRYIVNKKQPIVGNAVLALRVPIDSSDVICVEFMAGAHMVTSLECVSGITDHVNSM
jgi:hypothetical protein